MNDNWDLIEKNNALIDEYIRMYSETGLPIEVSFRSKTPLLKNTDRHTHLIHSYPAKLLMHIPFFFINNSRFSKKKDIVLDPFCGTGTVLLEALLAGRRVIGADANPLARLISEVKITPLDAELLKNELKKLIDRSRKYKKYKIPEVVNIDHWFPKRVQRELAQILKGINKMENQLIRNFFLVCFSNCVKKVSYADPRIGVPVKINPTKFKGSPNKFKEASEALQKIEEVDVFERFILITNQNIERLSRLGEYGSFHYAKVISSDARNITAGIYSNRKYRRESVQLILTSPPYAGAQKYIRSSSLNLGWLELAKKHELIELDSQNIGRENFHRTELALEKTGVEEADSLIQEIYNIDKVRAKIVAKYLIEMDAAIIESVRVLKKGGYLVFVVGNNKVCNKEFNTQDYLTKIIEKKGLTLLFKLIDDIKSYGLMTKRNKTADIISREWVLVFKK